MQKYLCFADFEFTCGSPAHRLKSEMLSVGVVVCDSEYNIMETYYCTARPNHFPKLTSQCKRLTKLTQAEINQSPDSENVLERVTGIMAKYEVAELYVWGNFDKPGLLSDRKQHIQHRKPHKNIDRVCSAIRDIQDEMVREMQLPQAVSIGELASAFGYSPENGSFHNALNDAEALYVIHKAVHTSDFRSCPEFEALKQERLEKLAAAKAAQEEKRRELALSYELSPEEKAYYEEITSSGREKAVKRFINLRLKLINCFNKYPEEESFVMVEYDAPRRIRIMPGSKYSDIRGPGVLRKERFSKASFGSFVVGICTETNDK